jgi:hypothetical protein
MRIARENGVSPVPGEDYHRCVDNIRRVGGAAEFSAGTGKLLIKRNDLNFSSLEPAVTTNIFSIFNNFQNPENVFAPACASVKLEDPRWVAPTNALSHALPP